ncbi:hypothetical protein Tco_1293783 [Tanacetum coccineum]
MDRFLRTTRVGIDHLHSLAYVSWTSSVRPDHDHFLRGTTLRSEQAACTVSIILFFFDFSLTFIGARDVALDEIPDVLPSPVCEWTLLFLSPNCVKTFLSLGPSLVNIVAFTGLLRQVGLSPSCHSLEKALVFCEGRVSLDAVTGLGLLFLVLLFMSHDLDSENLVCDFDASFHRGSHTVRRVWTTSYIDECRCRRIFLGYRYHRLLSVFGMLTFFLDSLCLVSYSFDLVTGGRPSWSDTQSCAESIPCGVVGLFATVCMVCSL